MSNKGHYGKAMERNISVVEVSLLYSPWLLGTRDGHTQPAGRAVLFTNNWLGSTSMPPYLQRHYYFCIWILSRAYVTSSRQESCTGLYDVLPRMRNADAVSIANAHAVYNMYGICHS